MTNFLSKITGKGMSHRGEEPIAISIQEHLVHLLNMRQGRTQHLEGYGLPDIHEIYFNLPGSLEVLATRIRETIERYEPRLTAVRVDQLEKPDRDADQFRVTYRISGQVIEGSSVSKLTFRTEVARDGRAITSLVRQYG